MGLHEAIEAALHVAKGPLHVADPLLEHVLGYGALALDVVRDARAPAGGGTEGVNQSVMEITRKSATVPLVVEQQGPRVHSDIVQATPHRNQQTLSLSIGTTRA